MTQHKPQGETVQEKPQEERIHEKITQEDGQRQETMQEKLPQKNGQQEKGQTQTQQTGGKTEAVVKEIVSWVKTIVLAMVIALLLNHYVIVNANVPTGSMQNTIQPGDRLIGFRLAYLNHTPERGDIVVFKNPVDPMQKEIFIKRLIGLPGEHIEIQGGKVYIDYSETPLEETYRKEEWIKGNDGIAYDIPQGCYFMMGDNRNKSLDARYWAEEAVKYNLADSVEEAVEKEYCFVNDDQILGKAIFRYFPSVTMMNQNPYDED